MKKTEQFVITVNRELGSGGRTVAEKLAKALNVAFYDKALIKELEKKFNLTGEEIERLKGQKNNWWDDFKRLVVPMSDLARAQFYSSSPNMEPDLLTTNDMFKAEVIILEHIAASESCVITGRSGFHVFKSHPNHLSIFIKAPLENRIARLMGKHPDMTKEKAEEIIEKVDKGRENYVNRFTGSSRYDANNYDLVINMANLTEDEAVKLILDYIEMSNK